MNILTFDTSFDKTYITLSKDKTLLSSYQIASNSEKYHSAYLISNLAKILKEHKMQMSDIDAIATNIGPGSFTGIRVCVTVAKIISQQLNLKVFGVSSLEIISQYNKSEKPSLIILDARKDKFYAAVYDKNETLVEPIAMTLNEIQELAQKEYFIITDAKSCEILSNNQIESWSFEGKNLPLGEYLMNITYQKLNQADENATWFNLKPLYIQPPPITMCKK